MSRAETGVEEVRTIAEMVRGQEAQTLIARFVGSVRVGEGREATPEAARTFPGSR